MGKDNESLASARSVASADATGRSRWDEAIERRQNAYAAEAVKKGHTLALDQDEDAEPGTIDWFYWSPDGHNGPGCSVCGWRACYHCAKPIPECGGEPEAARSEAQEAQPVTASPTPTVKPLVWANNTTRGGHIEADVELFGPGNGYCVATMDCRFWACVDDGHSSGDKQDIGDFRTLEEAQAACQADYTARILSALEDQS